MTDYTALDSAVAKIRGKNPNIAGAFDEVEKLLKTKDAPPPPPPVFATLLPAILPPGPGPVQKIVTVNDLLNALRDAPYGSIIDGGATVLDLAGATALWSRPGQAGVTTELRVKVRNGGTNAGVRITGDYFRATVDSSGSAAEGVKITDGASYVEVGGSLHDNTGQGLLVSGTGHHRQAVGVRFKANGDSTNLDHNVYWSTAHPGDLITNCEDLDPWAYNLQLYPQGDGLVVTMCSLTGGQQQPNERGGLVLGDGDGSGRWLNGTIVGLSIKDSPYSAAMHVFGSVKNTRVFDCCEIRNAGGGFIAAPGIAYTNCVRAESVLVDPSRYGWVLPFDIDGQPRVPGAVRAGCYA